MNHLDLAPRGLKRLNLVLFVLLCGLVIYAVAVG